MREICSKLTIDTPELRQWRHFLHWSGISIVQFKQVNTGCSNQSTDIDKKSREVWSIYEFLIKHLKRNFCKTETTCIALERNVLMVREFVPWA